MRALHRLAAFALLATVAGCGHGYEQTSAGTYIDEHRSDYYVPRTGSALSGTPASASATSLWRFPARIGLARIASGRIAPIPPREANIWITFADTHRDLGSFIPMNPLIAAFSENKFRPGNGDQPIGDTVRLAAAQQHLDAVLLYTTGVENDKQATPLSILELTIIGGYIVPSRRLTSQATATARLVDVRNGFTYGDLEATRNDSSLVPDYGSDDRKAVLAHAAESAAVESLSVKVGALASQLRTNLAGVAAPTTETIGKAP